MELVDTHAHLNMSKYDSDRDSVVESARDAGVKTIIDVGSDLVSSFRVVENCEKYEAVFGAVGVHPHDAGKMEEKALQDIASLLEHPKVVALGEIGLDYHYDFSPRDIQKAVFEIQLQLAKKNKIPVIIHIRKAMSDALEIIDGLNLSSWRGVFHCFGGSAYDVRRVLERGFYISFTGVISFKNFDSQEVVCSVPDDRLLLETDAPYMTPVPLRGKRNEPAFLTQTLSALSRMLGRDESTLAEQTTQNAKTLFNFIS